MPPCTPVVEHFAMDYYINLSGDDSHSGLSKTQPWRSIDRVNATQLKPGDAVWFQANQTFRGNVSLAGTPADTAAPPITIGSYGEGRATIDAGTGPGFFAKNMGGVRLVDLNFVGAGTEKNTSSGIWFRNTLPGAIKLAHIRIHKVDVSGFKHAGICIIAQPVDESSSGFFDVKITHATVHDNGDAGISCRGAWNPEQEGYAHANVYVGHCRVYKNHGIPGKGSHSGNGIVLAQVDRATIEYCEAYENGRLNEHQGGGPVGIWAWDANRVVIQFNESHHNRTGSSKDGGGFDLDGGVTNSLVQYNYSHDNDGAGYLLAQFSGARAFHDNVIRYNLSLNDGRKNNYGGIHIWSTGANGGISNTVFYHNTIFAAASANGNPAAVDCLSEGIRNIRFYNNTFVTGKMGARLETTPPGVGSVGGAVRLIRGKANPEVIFKDNTYLSV